MNTTHLIKTSLILLGTLIFCATAQAQDTPIEEIQLKLPAARQGYYYGVGAGVAFNKNYRTEDVNTTFVPGSNYYIRFGEMITDWLGAGFYIGGGGAEDERYSSGFGGLMLDLQLLPLDHLAIHLGVGGGGISLTDNEADNDDLQGTGGGYYMLGVSYDWFPFYESGTGGFSVTPTFQVHYLPGTNFEGTMVIIGLEALFWTGIPKNRLELDVDEAFKPEE